MPEIYLTSKQCEIVFLALVASSRNKEEQGGLFRGIFKGKLKRSK